MIPRVKYFHSIDVILCENVKSSAKFTLQETTFIFRSAEA